jgi:hypothetical protein
MLLLRTERLSQPTAALLDLPQLTVKREVASQ